MSVADRLAGLSPEQRALFEKLRDQQRKARPPQAPPVRRVTGPTAEGDWPLSLDQERFWFMEQLYPGGAGLNITAATRMRGPVSMAAVAAALDGIVRRHAAWRTAFPLVDGRPVQRVAPPRPQPLALIDLTGLPAERREAEALRLVGEGTAAPFPLETGPLVRSALARLDPADHVCLLTVHHLATDWISFQIAFGELAALCSGTPASALPEPPVQYPDFAVWQREWLQGEILDGLVAWWRGQLDGFPLALELPTDRPRPIVARMRGGRIHLHSSRELAEALHGLARRESATPFMAVLAAQAALLHRVSRQDRLILGANNANRNRPELEPVLGCFLTQVPFPIDLAGDPTFRELLARARQSALGSFAHQDLPFGKLVEALQPERDTSRQPVVQALVQVLDGQYSKTALGGVAFEAVDAWDGAARYDLMLTLFDYPDGLAGSLEYDADLFDATTARRLAELLFLQIETAAVDPEVRLSALPALSAAARHQALVEWNDTGSPLPGWTVPERFAAQAARTPEAVAVIAAGEDLTYGELERRSTALARWLRAAGVEPESRVALLLDRTLDVPMALLGVWKAGGAFVPLDPDAPPARIADLLDDVEPSAVVFRGSLPVPVPAGVEAVDLDDLRAPLAGELPAIRPGQLAYLLYTSGTTGRPKAVMVEHGSLAAILGGLLDRAGFGPDDRMPHLSRFTFDISLAELFPVLLAGGVCEILAMDEVLDLDDLLDALERSTRVIVGPSLLQRITGMARERGAERFAGLRTILTGGESVPPALREELLEVFPRTDLRVLYGPTETAVLATSYPVPRGRRHERSLIGRPLDGVEVRVMDPRGALVPLGAPGELWIGGPGVGRGYFHRPELTAERFVEVDGRRFYRSGDLVRQVPSEGGELEFLGRTDHQVKLRGFRIEPGEIEAALLGHPAVAEASVVPLGEGGSMRLVAYVSPAGVEVSELREHLAARLPAYMVPAAFVVLPELPLTAHAKVDRARLPAPGPASDEPGEAPRTPAEEVVAGIWCEVLGLERVSRTADFFELGGHSLLATQVITRLRSATGAELAVRELFQFPTVAALAAAVEASLSSGASPAPPIVPVSRDRDLPLSFAQERLWFLDRLMPGIAAYHIPLAVALRGDLVPEAMAAAIGGLVARHEALRTHFGEGVQIVDPPGYLPEPWTLPRVDLSALPEAARTAEARRLASEEAARPFDLAAGPVLRSTLLRLAPAEHALLLCVHHIAADGWSLGIMVQEIAALYRASTLPELPVQYADFAVWQREWLQGEVLERQLSYWRKRLEGAPRLDLPTDRPRPAVQGFRGALETLRQPAGRVRRRDATPFMVLLAALQALLARHTGQDDIVVGSPIANRNRAEIEPLVGFFVNTLVLRGDLSGDPPFSGLLAAARRTALEAFAHQDLPFERLVEEMRPERRLSLNPLFQVVLAVQNAPLKEVELPGLSLAPVDLDFPVTRFDLEVMVWEADGELTVQLIYDTDLFDRSTIERLAGRFDRLLASVAETPELRVSELPLLGADERRQLLSLGSGSAPAQGAGFLDRILAQPADAPAVGSMTYGELVSRASWLAQQLRVGPDVPVGLHVERSPELVIGALAVLLAGGAYVPLDPSHPAERLAGIVRESGMPVLLSRTPVDWAGEARVVLIADGKASFEPVPCPPQSLAYVIHTSGSTGRPKGVQVPRAGLQALVDWHLRAYGVTARDRATLLASPSFDASVWEIWPYLAAGASLHVPDEETRLSPERLLAWMAAERITLAFLPTPLAALAIETDMPEGLALRALLTGGDRLENGPRRPLPFELVNHYGPTESSVVATSAPVALGSERPPIGRPIDGTRVYVLDGWNLAPEGVPGELALGGAGLARGYLGRPDLTAERFVPDPFGAPGERIYRTGDRALWRGGSLHFLGRIDRQVKLRGIRIEPGEIEAALRRHPRVREAVVKAQEGVLAAWVVPQPEEEIAAASPVEHIAHWQELYDETYGRGPATGDLSFNIQGWNSSYTGEPIAASEMREWLEGTVERLLALPHRRMMEVGCGTGLLLFRLAPVAERYLGTDFSAVALEQVRAGLDRLPQVELDCRLADDWTGVAPGELDLVVLNSVVQYFPGVDYLARVLEGAVAAVAPGGAVFVGDVRSLPLLEAFAESVERFRSPDATEEELRQRVRRRVADEEELVVDPRFFLALAKRVPGVSRVDLRVKRGRAHNELTRFRYDVVVHVGTPSPALPRCAGEGAPALSTVEERLGERPEILALSLPNARLAAGVDPEDVRSLGERLGYDVELALDPDPFRFGALFRKRGSEAAFPDVAWPEIPESAFANDPMRSGEERRLVPELRRFLEAGLPESMVPSAFVLLDALPLTASGKIDLAALPAPGRSAEETYQAPGSPLEELLARTAAELLGLPRVGMRDNFFALGGHSLLATQLVSRLNQEHGVEASLQMVFDSATLADLADRIVAQGLEGADDAELLALLEEGRP
ncbi:MAG: amino acid adenylation domain-containing protein [Thermoanaerobaculia bacterium]